MANWAWSRSDCCGNTTYNWSHPCNQPNSMFGTSGSLRGILNNWGVSSSELHRALTWSETVTEINARRPFVMRFGWTSGGGHFLNGYGYDDASPTYVHYMDPWPGNGYTKSTYSWTVRSTGHNWTHTLRVTTAPLPSAPVLISPANGATVSGTSVTFSWNAVSGAGGYWLEVNSSPSWTSGTRRFWNSVSGTSQTVSGFPNNGTTFYWRVWAGNATGWGPASAGRSFINGAGSTTTPPAPSLVSPANNANVASTSVNFSWGAVSGATTYWLEVNSSSSWGTGTRKFWDRVDATSRTVTALPNNGTTFYWRVWAGNAAGWGPASAGRSFINGRAVTGEFEEHFRSRPANWLQDSGAWSIASSEYWYTSGVAGAWSLSTYNAQFGNSDYSARIWRNSSGNNWASGIVIRAGGAILSNGQLSNYYWFAINRDGSYSVWKYVNGVETALKSWTTSSAVNQGSVWNTLRVVASRSSLAFYINGTMVWVGSDSSLTSGRAGVGMYRSATSTGDGFWVDWARLTVPSGSLEMNQTISPEQPARNDTDKSETVFANGAGAYNADVD